MAYQNYGDERQRMMQAAGLTPQLAAQDYFDIAQLAAAGSTRERNYQDLINAEIARFNYEQQLPYNKLARYLGMIQGDYGGTTQTTQSSVSAVGNDILSGMMQAIPFLQSL
jgi:hypothetical protein